MAQIYSPCATANVYIRLLCTSLRDASLSAGSRCEKCVREGRRFFFSRGPHTRRPLGIARRPNPEAGLEIQKSKHRPSLRYKS